MGTRHGVNQGLHDLVLEAAARREEQELGPGYIVHRNPGQQKNKAVDGEYPDIVNELRATSRVVSIDEVETDDTVNESEVGQWKTYGQLGPAFDLIVPDGSQADADVLIRQHRVQLRALWTWSRRGNEFSFRKVKDY